MSTENGTGSVVRHGLVVASLFSRLASPLLDRHKDITIPSLNSIVPVIAEFSPLKERERERGAFSLIYAYAAEVARALLSKKTEARSITPRPAATAVHLEV